MFLDGLLTNQQTHVIASMIHLTNQQTHMIASMIHLRADRSVHEVTLKPVQPADNGLSKLLTKAELRFQVSTANVQHDSQTVLI